MADYQSLLTRAIANLPRSSTAAARQAIYGRARKALLTQLRSLRPPLPESDIAREETALDKAIAAVEAQFAPAEAGPEGGDAPPDAEATTAPAPTPPARASAPARPAEPRQVPGRPAAAQRSPAPPVSTRAGVPLRADSDAARPPPIHISPPNADGGAAPPVIAAETHGDSAAPANLAGVVPSDGTRPIEASDAPPIVAARADEAETLVDAHEAPLAGDHVAIGRPEAEGLRPIAPSVPVEKRRSWPWAALAVMLGIVLSVAVAAILMRQKPQDLAINPPASPSQEAAQAPAKIAQRAQPSVENNAAAPPAAPSASQPQAAGTPAEGSAPANAPQEAQPEGQLPSAARAAMLVASADNPQKPVVNLGSTVWSTLPAPQGQPAGVAVEADANIPDLKMRASMILRKNTDPTLQATHTIDLKFTFQDGAPVNGFKDVGLPQMRKLDSTASEALNSVKVKISDDYFLFALAKGDQEAARNLDLMRTSAWFDFPLLLNDNRIAKLVFQKSADGEAMLEKAFDAWK